MPVNVKRRKRNVILYGAAAVLTAIVIVVTVAMSTFETLGYGSVGNTIATNGALIGLILTTLALIGLARLYTPKGGITSWRRIGTIGRTPGRHHRVPPPHIRHGGNSGAGASPLGPSCRSSACHHCSAPLLGRDRGDTWLHASRENGSRPRTPRNIRLDLYRGSRGRRIGCHAA